MTRLMPIIFVVCLPMGLYSCNSRDYDSGNKQSVAPSGGALEEDPPSTMPVDKEPTVVSRVNPVYPAELAKAGIEGKVFVKLLVAADGTVKKVQVASREGGAPELEQASMEAARQWIFTPAEAKGKPVAVWVTVPFMYKLSRDPVGQVKGDAEYLKGYIAGLKKSLAFYDERARDVRKRGGVDTAVEREMVAIQDELKMATEELGRQQGGKK